METKKGLLILILVCVILSSSSLAWSESTLVVVRDDADGLWKRLCNGDVCSSWESFPGRLRQSPSVSWDEAFGKWVVIGVSAGKTMWRGTFEPDGTFNNDWKATEGLTPSAAGVASRPGSVRVYDAQDQFLGRLLTVMPGDAVVAVYIPTLKATAVIDYYSSDIAEFTCYGLYFDEPNCRSTPYVELSCLNQIFKHSEKYYLASQTAPVTKAVASYRLLEGQCETPQGGSAEMHSMTPVYEVQLPFTTPITLPLSFR